MKKLILIILIVIPFCTYSQVKKHIAHPQCDFTGIGIFKIGTDTSLLINYANTHVIEIRNCLGFDDLQRIKNNLETDNKTYLLRLYKTVLAHVTESFCPDVTEFYLSKYIVSDIPIKNIHLKYYKNQLVEFGADFSENTVKAMTGKYGKPVLTITSDTSSCMHNFTGIKTPLIAKTYSNQWYNGKITVYSDMYDHYDEHCEKSVWSFFLYTIDNKEWKECEKINLNKEINKNNTIDKSKLKDF